MEDCAKGSYDTVAGTFYGEVLRVERSLTLVVSLFGDILASNQI